MTRLRAVFVLGLAFCLLVLTPLGAAAAPGELDPTFGEGGLVTTAFSENVWGRVAGLAVQPDGKIVAGGDCADLEGQPYYCLARYETDGSLDSSFGTGGKVMTPVQFGFSGGTEANALALQADGKIVVAGSCVVTTQDGLGAYHGVFCVMRFNTDGTLEDRGAARIGGSTLARGITIQPDGKIVIAGYCATTGINAFCLARFNSDLTLDTSWGGNFHGDVGCMLPRPDGCDFVYPLGTVAWMVAGSNHTMAHEALVQPDGMIVAVGTCRLPNYQTGTDSFCLARWHAGGHDRTVTTEIGSWADATSAVMQPDGKIVVAGWCSTPPPDAGGVQFCLARYNADLSLDPLFGTGGVTDLIERAPPGERPEAVALQPDGKIVASGFCSGGGLPVSCLRRYNGDGSLDGSFGSDGIVRAGFGGFVYALAVQGDGKSIVAGSCGFAPFCLARFDASATETNQAPTDVALSASSVAENEPAGATVGSLSTIDPDVGDSFTYSLVAGAGDTDNDAFTVVGGELKTDASFDFESKSSHAIRVRSTDAGGLSFEKQLTISVTNVNEAPVGVNDTHRTNLGTNLAIPVATGVLANDTDPDAGTTLSAILDASTTHGTLTLASDGSFLYTPAAGFAGSDSFSYRASDGSLTSNLATVTIVMSPPTGITVTPANPTIANGTNQQFTATGTYADGSTADLSSSVTWASATPAVATISAGGLAHALAAGASKISATLGSVSGDTLLTVALTPQTITFDPLADKAYGDPDFAVSATASSGLPVSFAAAGNCTAAGTTVHITGAGSCTITASQPGNASYAAAPSVSRTFSIAKAGQTITFAALANKRLGDPDFTVAASASSGLAVAFSARGNCTIAGARVHLVAVGSCTITASQAGNANYNAAPAVARTFSIARRVQPRCTVPRVIAKPLAVARSMLSKAHCRTGTVTRVYSRARRRGVVIGQSRRPGRVLPASSKIDLVVSRGRRG